MSTEAYFPTLTDSLDTPLENIVCFESLLLHLAGISARWYEMYAITILIRGKYE